MFPFPPLRPVPTAAREEYLRQLRSAKGQNSPSPKVAVPEIPKVVAPQSFKKIRAKISKKRTKVAKSPASDSSSGRARIDGTLDSQSTNSSEGTDLTVDHCPEINPEPVGLGRTILIDPQGDLSVDFRDVDPGKQEDSKTTIFRDGGAFVGSKAAEDDRSTYPDSDHARYTKNDRIFRACANLLTHPFAADFTIDASKLNSSSDLLSILQAGPCSRLDQDQLYILDIGGRISDEYTQNIEGAAHLSVIKAVQGSNSSEVVDCHSTTLFTPLSSPTVNQSNEPTVLILEDLSKLPLCSGSVQAISARSLYKDTTIAIPQSNSVGGPLRSYGVTEASLRSCLQECHRVLSKRGIIEYIYFNRDVENPGPLITEMEKCFDSLSRGTESSDYQFLSSDKFVDLLEDAGFSGGKSVVLKFPYMILSKLFTRDGQRQAFNHDLMSLFDDEHDMEKLPSGQFSRREFDYAVRKLFTSIEKEATLLNTSWKCVVGWAVKTPRRR